MQVLEIRPSASKSPAGSPAPSRWLQACPWLSVFLLLLAVIPSTNGAQIQQPAKPRVSEAIPEPAAAAILAAFDRYEVVGMPVAHGGKDVDDFILSLIRNPAFSEKVNDVVVECGNSLYQPSLDRYIAGEDVPFAEARKVWRNTTQPMCGTSAFFQEFFPLMRAINQKLPPGKRLRVLAGDPPIDWDQVKSFEDYQKFYPRDISIASVMKKEVLSKHRKALMLFGTLHLVHGAPTEGPHASAVSIYEREYPNVTFVISGLEAFDTDLQSLSSSPFLGWPIPSLTRAKGTWLGALDSEHFFPAPAMTIDKDCNVHYKSVKELQKRMEELVDAFLYLGPQDLRLREKMPADIALDLDYRMELQRRESLPGFRGMGNNVKEVDKQILNGSDNPLLIEPKSLDSRLVVQSCLELKRHGSTPNDKP